MLLNVLIKNIGLILIISNQKVILIGIPFGVRGIKILNYEQNPRSIVFIKLSKLED